MRLYKTTKIHEASSPLYPSPVHNSSHRPAIGNPSGAARDKRQTPRFYGCQPAKKSWKLPIPSLKKCIGTGLRSTTIPVRPLALWWMENWSIRWVWLYGCGEKNFCYYQIPVPDCIHVEKHHGDGHSEAPGRGKLRLDDPAEMYIPELKAHQYLTADAPRMTVRNLMTHSAGFPEDNPWGDRQLADSDADLINLIKSGLSNANVPSFAYEYSNLAFAMLGHIITAVSGKPYQQYITDTILKPLGMNDTKWEYTQVPAVEAGTRLPLAG